MEQLSFVLFLEKNITQKWAFEIRKGVRRGLSEAKGGWVSY